LSVVPAGKRRGKARKPFRALCAVGESTVFSLQFTVVRAPEQALLPVVSFCPPSSQLVG
jgi:hypothetical protein